MQCPGIDRAVDAVSPTRPAAVLERTARALEVSADLADHHAERHLKAGRAEAAAYERGVAARARNAARRARQRAARLATSARENP
jgi:hypothetical protein